MQPKIPQAVVDMMAGRAHRMHHYLWHEVRNGWLRYSPETRRKLTALGWEPPRPARSADSRSILDNDSGEDFFYMHREMIAAVDKKLAAIGDAAYPKVEGWPAPPPPADADWPVPPAYAVGDRDFDAYIAACKSERFYAGSMTQWMQAYTDPAVLRRMSLGELGSRIEFTIHNNMHMRWSEKPERIRPETDVTAPEAIDPAWDRPSYNWLGDTYSSHVHSVFWKLHGWVDLCIGRWMKANQRTGPVPWRGTWAGPMPQDAPERSFFALMPASSRVHGLSHDHHLASMIAAAKLVRDSGIACHFYDNVKVPPLPG